MSEYLFLALRIIMALCLYAFLGWALYSIWHYLKVTSSTVLPRQVPSLTLIPLDFDTGPQVFTNPEVLIGRDPNCAYPLPDEIISAHHARFNYRHNQWWLEDLKSTNGTLLNGERVEVPTIVVNDDEVSFGTKAFQIKME